MQKQVRKACITERNEYKIYAESAVTSRTHHVANPTNSEGPFNPLSKIEFSFPITGFLDPQSVRIEYTVAQSHTGAGTKVGFWNSPVDVISRLNVKSNAEVLIDIEAYNVLYELLTAWCVPWSSTATFGTILDGVNVSNLTANIFFAGTPQAAPATLVASSQGQTYSHNLVVGPFETSRYIPLYRINSLKIELWLDTAENAMMKQSGETASAPTFSLNNVKMYYETLTLDTPLAAQIDAKDELFIHYTEMRCHQKTLPANTGQITAQVTDRVTSLKQIFCVPVIATSLNNFAYNGIGDHRISPATGDGAKIKFSNYQFRVNGVFYPTYPINNTAEMAVQNSKAFGVYQDADAGGFVTSANFCSGDPRFIDTSRAKEVYAFSFERERCPLVLSGLNTLQMQSDPEFIFQCPPTNPEIRWYIFTAFDAIMVVKRGVIAVSR